MVNFKGNFKNNKNNSFRPLVITISISLICLIIIQFYWTYESLKSAKIQFEQDVKKSFYTLNNNLEKDEAAFYYTSNIIGKNENWLWKNKLDSLKSNVKQRVHKSIDTFIIDDKKNERVIFKQFIKFQSNDEGKQVMIELDISDSGNIEKSIDTFSLDNVIHTQISPELYLRTYHDLA